MPTTPSNLRVRLGASAAAGLLAFSLAACTSSKADSQDQAIDAAIQSKFSADPALQGDSITAAALNGVVTLTGTVPSEAARTAAAADAQVPGVTQVNNQIGTNLAANPSPNPTAAPVQTASASAPPAPATAAPTPAEPGPAMTAVEPVEVEAGTPLHVRLQTGLSSSNASQGQGFRGTLAQAVRVNGQIAIPRGAEVRGTVVAADSAGHFKGRSRLALRLETLRYDGHDYSLRTSEVTRESSSRGTRSTEAIGGGAAVGALIGALAGHGKGAAIGAVTGAGAGTAAEALTKAPEVELPAETELTFNLSHSLQVVPGASNR